MAPRGGREEVPAVAPSGLSLARELEIRLVDEAGGRERLSRLEG